MHFYAITVVVTAQSTRRTHCSHAVVSNYLTAVLQSDAAGSLRKLCVAKEIRCSGFTLS